ncbi:hypothetical protein [Persicitalea jodogahamensis]|uniref:Uncharacterized protein n=1 Tax=Persicitalea jodogahamensis TaxID=402147 RepID=A0A8J3G7J7_9BACT|nr:hypothetical protein [Persicitalea jodogahamensis]GHB56000.1 hypothetical protein GCM10007390_06580 [Persicitalea jodogahamensis]
MKKHNNIDELFARKLSGLERTPSPDLWQRIEQGQEKETRRLGAWYWYAAASVTILLMAGYLVWQSQTETFESQGQLARTEQVTRTDTDKPDSPAFQTADTEKLEIERNDVSVLPNDNRVVAQIDVSPTIINATAPKQPETERTPILEDMKIAKVVARETSPEQLVAKNEDVKLSQSVEVPGTALTDLSQNRVIVAHVETEDLTTETQKSSKFLRVLRQLKNAKQGDEVEWDEIGINPKRILARADERIRNGEDKISDKYQELKNKTKL